MSDAISAHGSIVAWQATPGGAFSDIGEIAGDIVVPSLSRNPIEVTTHNDDIDAFVLGVLRRGMCTFPINFIAGNAGHDAATGLQHAIIVNLKTGFRVTFPDASAWIFSGGVANFGMKAPVDGALQADVSIRPTGLMKIDSTNIG
jgi:hypothetical protein